MHAKIIDHCTEQCTNCDFDKRIKFKYAYNTAKKDWNKSIAGHLYCSGEHKRLEYVDTQEQKDRKNERRRK